MSKYISLGYGDVNGKGKAVVLAGPEIELTDQVRLVTGIKASGRYPEGVVRVELAEVVIRTTGICTKASSAVAAKDAKQQQLRIKALQDKDPVRQVVSQKQKLDAAIATAAAARNLLIGDRNRAQVAVNDAQYRVDADPSKENKATLKATEDTLAKIQSDLGKAQTALDELTVERSALNAPKKK